MGLLYLSIAHLKSTSDTDWHILHLIGTTPLLSIEILYGGKLSSGSMDAPSTLQSLRPSTGRHLFGSLLDSF